MVTTQEAIGKKFSEEQFPFISVIFEVLSWLDVITGFGYIPFIFKLNCVHLQPNYGSVRINQASSY